MSAATVTPSAPSAPQSPSARAIRARYRGKVLASARIALGSGRSSIAVPVIVLAVIFAVNLVIWALIAGSQPSGHVPQSASAGMQWSGASFYVFVYAAILGAQAMVVGVPFALGWGTTRRDFALGALLALVGRAAVWGVVFAALSLIETATGGWGLGGRMFTVIYFPQGPWYTVLVGFVLLFLVVTLIGSAMGAIWMRWRGLGMLVAFVIATVIGALVTGALIALTTSGVMSAMVIRLQLLDLDAVAYWSLLIVPCLLLALLTWALVRRAPIRS